jgi:hypothetical protein
MMNQERLKELFDYNPVTGKLTWKINRGSRARKGGIAGSKATGGYRQINLDGKVYREHRIIWLYVYGEFPPDYIDHINHDRTDNRICNLRVVTKKQNGQNMKKRNSNTSGITGVSWHKPRSKWCAYIMIDGIKKHLGLFHTKIEAAQRRLQANLESGFHHNHGKS